MTPSPTPPASSEAHQAKPHATLFRLGLTPLIIHFKSSGYISPQILDSHDVKILKRMVTDTARQEEIRQQLGSDIKVWNDLTSAVQAAVPSLSDRCFNASKPPDSADYDLAASTQIVANYHSLLKDLARLNSLCSIARNVFNIGEPAQSLAVKAGFDRAIFDLIRLCIKVTVRPYGGYESNGVQAGAQNVQSDQDKWDQVTADYKALLTRSLQVLNNMVAQNERRKLMLWVELFDSQGTENMLNRHLESVAAKTGQSVNDLKVDSVELGAVTVEVHPEPSRQPAQARQEVVEGDQPLALDAWDDPMERQQTDLYPQPNPMFDLEKALRGNGEFEDGAMYPNLGMQFKLPQVLQGLRNEFEDYGDDEERGKLTDTLLDLSNKSPYLQWLRQNFHTIKKEYKEHGTITIPAEFATPRERFEEQRQLSHKSEANANVRIASPTKELLEALRNRENSGEVGKVSQSLDALQINLQHFKEDTSQDPTGQHQLSVELDGLKVTAGVDSSDPAYKHLYPTWSSHAGDSMANFKSYLHGGDATEIGKSDGLTEPQPATEEDYRPTCSAAHGAGILDRGKADLLKRLEPDNDRHYRGRQSERSRTDSVASGPHSSNNGYVSPTIPSDVVEAAESEEESEEEDYQIPGDDGRGLLTDIPLILAPTEIEVLPMIILSAIVPPAPGTPGYGKTSQEIAAIKNIHTVRCHLLLAQDNGHNLLRELLIFVAAWDLREDELYFKLMVKIMEAVLNNGLMPFAYHTFRESKDIISPAQAVILKLLTNIFRTRQAASLPVREGEEQREVLQPYPQRVDVKTVSFLFTEFRRTIIPQTCALIFLQGKIHDGTASQEDFPLNLWDMERMYEGVYQYLEFFAILTEHEGWKAMMAEWEITSELVTLLEEMHTAIPRGKAGAAKENIAKYGHALEEASRKGKETWNNFAQDVGSRDEDQVSPSPPSPPPPPPPPLAHQTQTPQRQHAICVERPYDLSEPSPLLSNRDSQNLQQQQPQQHLPPPSSLVPPPPVPQDDEPSDFEWRNLKKLTVLVLSSLTWKNKRIQRQLTAADAAGIPGRGLRALLNCCAIDDYNPYIKEHGIMAMRFALEGNLEGQKVVGDLKEEIGREKGASPRVPEEVLDLKAYETFVNANGQVQLRRRERKV